MKRKEAIEVLETIRIGSSRTEHEAIDKAVKALKNTKKEYNRGLKDAWECVRKITSWYIENKKEVFNLKTDSEILKTFTAQEAMQKIKDYEERKTEIKCGTCKYDGSSFSPCIKCKDNSEFEPMEEQQKPHSLLDAYIGMMNEKIEERHTTNLCDKCAKTKCSVKMQLEEQNIKLKGCDFYEDKESK